jgi:hypothetical protein
VAALVCNDGRLAGRPQCAGSGLPNQGAHTVHKYKAACMLSSNKRCTSTCALERGSPQTRPRCWLPRRLCLVCRWSPCRHASRSRQGSFMSIQLGDRYACGSRNPSTTGKLRAGQARAGCPGQPGRACTRRGCTSRGRTCSRDHMPTNASRCMLEGPQDCCQSRARGSLACARPACPVTLSAA